MKDLLPNLEDIESVAVLLLAADILSKRGEAGPLSRVFVCRPKAPVVRETQETGVDPQERRGGR